MNKFILSELASKFILAEKYILTEATAEEKNKAKEAYLKAKDAFNKIYPNAKTFLEEANGSKELTTDEKFINEIKPLEKEIAAGTITDVLDLKNKGKEYIDKVSAKLDKIPNFEEKYPQIDQLVFDIKNLIEKGKDEDIKGRLGSEVEKLGATVDEVFGSSEKADADKTVSENALKNLNNINDFDISAALEAMDNGDEKDELANAVYGELGNITTILTDITKTITDAVGKKDTSDAALAALNDALTDAYDKLKENKKAASLADLSNKNKSAEESEDAAHLIDLLKAAKNDPKAFEAALMSILKLAFGSNDDLINAILKLNVDGAIADEIIHYGPDAKQNPFLYFLDKNQDLLKNGSITPEKYKIIHNAFVKGNASGVFGDADLRGTGRFGNSDIIFSGSLYDYGPDDITKYFNLREQVINLFNGSTKFSNDLLAEKYQNNIKNFFADLMYEGGDLFNPKGSAAGPSANRQLKGLKAIEDELKNCFDEEALKNSKPKGTTAVNEKVVKSWIESLGGDKRKVGQLIIYLATRFVSASSAKAVQELLDKYAETRKVPLDAANIVPLSTTIGKPDITDKNLADVIKQIAEAAGLEGAGA